MPTTEEDLWGETLSASAAVMFATDRSSAVRAYNDHLKGHRK